MQSAALKVQQGTAGTTGGNWTTRQKESRASTGLRGIHSNTVSTKETRGLMKRTELGNTTTAGILMERERSRGASCL
jgi:hypothetical protein